EPARIDGDPIPAQDRIAAARPGSAMPPVGMRRSRLDDEGSPDDGEHYREGPPTSIPEQARSSLDSVVARGFVAAPGDRRLHTPVRDLGNTRVGASRTDGD